MTRGAGGVAAGSEKRNSAPNDEKSTLSALSMPTLRTSSMKNLFSLISALETSRSKTTSSLLRVPRMRRSVPTLPASLACVQKTDTA